MSDFDGMKIKKLEWNYKGTRKLLQSDEVMTALKEIAEEHGEIQDSFVGFDRCHVRLKEK